jgi:ankyrin repeat protein
MTADDQALRDLLRGIAAGNATLALALLAAAPRLATAAAAHGGTRRDSAAHFLADIGYQLYAGTTALHVAAAGYRVAIAGELIGRGADVRARNRRGAEPLHAAAVGLPGSSWWNPPAQAETITLLIKAGAAPNARDLDGATPLHRAVRTRCSAAVKALLEGGADVNARNTRGSTALRLAGLSTGRGGSGTAAAKAEQAAIVALLTRHGAI